MHIYMQLHAQTYCATLQLSVSHGGIIVAQGGITASGGLNLLTGGLSVEESGGFVSITGTTSPAFEAASGASSVPSGYSILKIDAPNLVSSASFNFIEASAGGTTYMRVDGLGDIYLGENDAVRIGADGVVQTLQTEDLNLESNTAQTVIVTAGAASSSAPGGSINVNAGSGQGTQSAGSIMLTGGSVTGAGNSGNGGNVNIQGGAAGIGNGGNIYINAGVNSLGQPGSINIAGPTAITGSLAVSGTFGPSSIHASGTIDIVGAADLHSKGMTMADGPDWRRQQAADDHFAVIGHFDQESQKVDAYWGGASRGSQIRRLILSRMFN